MRDAAGLNRGRHREPLFSTGARCFESPRRDGAVISLLPKSYRLNAKRDRCYVREGGAGSRRSAHERNGEGDQRDWTFKQPRRRAVSILGVPVEAGAGVAGCAMGPAMLRTAGIVRTLKELGQDVVDRGDLVATPPPRPPPPPDGRARHFAEISAWARTSGARNPRGHAGRASSDRPRRRPLARHGLDRRRRPPRRRGGAKAVRPVARRAFGLQHAADLPFGQHARNARRDAERRARLRRSVRR